MSLAGKMKNARRKFLAMQLVLPLSLFRAIRAYVCVCVFMQWKTCILEENQKIEDPELGQCVIRRPARTDSNSDSDSSC